ncbi:hypothetical protein IFVP69_C2170214 [Vibrio parahaemolyticus]
MASFGADFTDIVVVIVASEIYDCGQHINKSNLNARLITRNDSKVKQKHR